MKAYFGQGEKVMRKQEQPAKLSNDEKIIDMYWERNPDAIYETDRKYGAMLQNVAHNILFNALDCEECKNDTYLQIWNSIPSVRPAKFSAFIAYIVRCIAFSRYKEITRKKRIPSQLIIPLQELDTISSGLSLEDLHEVKEVGRLITEYVKQLNERQRYIFIDRYYFAEPIEKTASELSISVRTAYREVERIKQGLKEYLQRNGVHV